ncbi:MAG: hypothetical protein FWG43_00485 [Clostridiales bacterium]|nr:hypothetical protein [Clostridiales bacterium]
MNKIPYISTVKPYSIIQKKAFFLLQAKLSAADKQITEGKLYTHDEVFSRLKERVGS